MKENFVYVAMSADGIHHGHINIIKRASQYGRVIVGLHTDEAIALSWRIPILSYQDRLEVVSNIKGVYQVVPQCELDQVPNLRQLKPRYVFHGEDWKNGPEKNLRERVIEVLKEWDGELIEIARTEGEGVNRFDYALSIGGVTADYRRAALRKLLHIKRHLRVLEAHNGLTGLIVENTILPRDNGVIKQFDAIWISSLCDSTAKGKPDIELVDFTSRLNTINEILEVTTKPIILDGDTGGKIEHLIYTVRSLERLGVSAIIIEDKVGSKKNSLFGTEAEQTQDSIEHFCEKIKTGKCAQITNDFMIIARIESLILAKGLQEALVRAKAYIEAGADGIMIHSIDKTGQEIFDFCAAYHQFEKVVPLIVVPTAYSQRREQEMYDAGVNVVIYANHLLRAAYHSMHEVAVSILKNDRAKECEEYCASIQKILSLIE